MWRSEWDHDRFISVLELPLAGPPDLYPDGTTYAIICRQAGKLDLAFNSALPGPSGKQTVNKQFAMENPAIFLKTI